MAVTSMSDIYKVFAIVYMMWVSTRIHHHYITVTFIGPNFFMSVEFLIMVRHDPHCYVVMEAVDQ